MRKGSGFSPPRHCGEVPLALKVVPCSCCITSLSKKSRLPFRIFSGCRITLTFFRESYKYLSIFGLFNIDLFYLYSGIMGLFDSITGFLGGIADGVVAKIAPGVEVSIDFIVFLSLADPHHIHDSGNQAR
jgi:hypothetical protein